MKSTLSKIQFITFSQFQSFFNMERFIDRGIPVVITFYEEEEQETLNTIKNAFQSFLGWRGEGGKKKELEEKPELLDDEEEKEDCRVTDKGQQLHEKGKDYRGEFPLGSADENEEGKQNSQTLEAIRRATEILMSESLYTLCLCDFLAPISNVRKSTYSGGIIKPHIMSFKPGYERVIPLNMSLFFSMSISVFFTDCNDKKVDEDTVSSDDGREDKILWDSIRTKKFPDKYVFRETYVKDVCKAFKSKNVYTFIQRSNEIVLFPPSCAKQGKVESKVCHVAMWPVHNILSLTLNLFIRDLSPTKSMDKKAALGESIQSFIYASQQRQVYSIQNEAKAFIYFAEALVHIDNMCYLLNLNFGSRLHSYEEYVPKIYIHGKPFSECSYCGSNLYRTAFYMEKGKKKDIICVSCFRRIKDNSWDIVETIFIDPEKSIKGANDNTSFHELFQSMENKFSFDPQFFEIFETAKSILPPFSKTFCLNGQIQPKKPYKPIETDEKRGMWDDWKLYFREQIYPKELIATLLHAKESLYRLCMPVERFYSSPIMFVLFLAHSLQQKEIDMLVISLYEMEYSCPCMYTTFVRKFLECANTGIFKAWEKDLIYQKLVEQVDLKSMDAILSHEGGSSIVMDKDIMDMLDVVERKMPNGEKAKMVCPKISSPTQINSPCCVLEGTYCPNHVNVSVIPTIFQSMILETKSQHRSPSSGDAPSLSPPSKKVCVERPLSARTEYDESWLEEYTGLKFYLSKKAISRLGQDLPDDIKIVTEEFVVTRNFAVEIECFLVSIDKSPKSTLAMYRENMSFLSTVRLTLSEMLSGVKSFNVLPFEWKRRKPGKALAGSRENILKLLDRVLKNENEEKEKKGKEFTMDLFYKLLRTRSSESGKPLFVDMFSFENKEKYGWASFNSTNIQKLPYKKLFDMSPMNIFGFDFM